MVEVVDGEGEMERFETEATDEEEIEESGDIDTTREAIVMCGKLVQLRGVFNKMAILPSLPQVAVRPLF